MAAEENAEKGQGKEPGTASGGEKHPPEGKRQPTDEEARLLKENMAYKARLQKLEKTQAEAEENRLKAQGEFKTLAEKAEARAKAAQERLKLAEVKRLALQAGIMDPDLMAIADLSTVTIEDDGSVTGAAEAIEVFKAAKPSFFGQPNGGQQQQPGQKPTTTPKPNGQNAGGQPVTFSDWEKMPVKDRYEWAAKNPQAYQALCNARKASLSKR